MSAQFNELASVWRVIPGFTNYEVNQFGQLRSPRGILKPWIDADGYASIAITNDERRKTKKRVHQLVALAFIGPCPKGMHTRHLDGDPSNVHPSNLAYGTQSENEYDKRDHGTAQLGERHGRARLTEADVVHIRSLRFPIVSRLASQYGVNISTITAVLKGISWRHVAFAPDGPVTIGDVHAALRELRVSGLARGPMLADALSSALSLAPDSADTVVLRSMLESEDVASRVTRHIAEWERVNNKRIPHEFIYEIVRDLAAQDKRHLSPQPVEGNAVREALRQIKLTALTGVDGSKALTHIVRLCIDAGVTEQLDALPSPPPAAPDVDGLRGRPVTEDDLNFDAVCAAMKAFDMRQANAMPKAIVAYLNAALASKTGE